MCKADAHGSCLMVDVLCGRKHDLVCRNSVSTCTSSLLYFVLRLHMYDVCLTCWEARGRRSLCISSMLWHVNATVTSFNIFFAGISGSFLSKLAWDISQVSIWSMCQLRITFWPWLPPERTRPCFLLHLGVQCPCDWDWLSVHSARYADGFGSVFCRYWILTTAKLKVVYVCSLT